jgi:hypothetical protein
VSSSVRAMSHRIHFACVSGRGEAESRDFRRDVHAAINQKLGSLFRKSFARFFNAVCWTMSLIATSLAHGQTIRDERWLLFDLVGIT